MKRASWAFAMLLVVAGCLPIHAQLLTEQDFLESALANHPGVAAAEAGVAVASGARRQARIISNPVVSWEREEPDAALRQALIEKGRQRAAGLSWKDTVRQVETVYSLVMESRNE